VTLVIALQRFLSEEEYRKNGKAELLVFADSRETLGDGTSRKVEKVHPIYHHRRNLSSKERALNPGIPPLAKKFIPLALWSGAGDTLILRECNETCDRMLKKMFEEKWDRQPPDFGQFHKAAESIGNELRKKMPLRPRDQPEMVLGSVDLNGRVSLYQFPPGSDFTPELVHDDPGYAILGSGKIPGGAHALYDLLGYTLKNSWKFEADVLAAFLINRVTEVQENVGGDVDGYIMSARKLERLENTAEYNEQSRLRTDVIRLVWKLCDDSGDEKRILKELTKLEKSYAKKR
jgi:hypothetical protein